MGADRAVLLSDRVFAGSDTLATARILAEGIRRIGAFDLICCGNYTVDGSTAQVPSQVAELLGVPNVMHVSQMELRPGSTVVITQEIERGYARLEGKPPLLLSFIKDAQQTTVCVVPRDARSRKTGDRNLEQPGPGPR